MNRDILRIASDAPRPTRMEIIHAVARHTRVPVKEMQGPYRGRSTVRARFIYYYLARNYTMASYPLIGKACNRDHSTVMHGVEAVNRRRDYYAAEIDAVKAELGL